MMVMCVDVLMCDDVLCCDGCVLGELDYEGDDDGDQDECIGGGEQYLVFEFFGEVVVEIGCGFEGCDEYEC